MFRNIYLTSDCVSMCVCSQRTAKQQMDTQFDINSDTVLVRHDAAKDTSNNKQGQMNLSMALLYKCLFILP